MAGRLGAPFVLVVGKGGVGKTTTAGALALALADAGERVHLLSTDPAHSLADLLGAGPHPCGPRLSVEELDAPRLVDERLRSARPELLELLDRGTWLERDEAERFLALSLPGTDELGGALRLAALSEDVPRRLDRVVVDTAPTGHALRLLEAAERLETWAAALDALEAKAGAVRRALIRVDVPGPAQAFLEGLRADVDRFRRSVLARCGVVVVERDEPVVRAETERLLDVLATRGLPVVLRVRTGRPAVSGETPGEADGRSGGSAPTQVPSSGPPLLEVPWRADLTGCAALRSRWGRPAGRGRAVDLTPSAGADVAEALAGPWARPLVLVVGKGGVGKSTWAAAVAVATADAGRAVRLLGTDPAGSLGDVLRTPLEAGETTLLEGRLRVEQVDAERRFAEFRERYRADVEAAFAALGLERSAALDRAVVERLLDLAPPGLDEAFALAALLDDPPPQGAPSRELTVVDTAPTGHLLRLLALPDTALAWTRELLRVLLRTRAALGLDAFAERLLDFAKRLKGLQLKLQDPARAGAWLVSLDGPLDRPETRRLRTALDGAGVACLGSVLNRAAAEEVGAAARERGDATPPAVPYVRLRLPELAPPPHGPAGLRRLLSHARIVR